MGQIRRWPDSGEQAQIVSLYVDGLSTRRVAALLGFSPSCVANWCQPFARDRLDAVRLHCAKHVAQTSHWRTCRQRARKLMQKHVGRKLLRTEHVHHKDEDYTNNTLDNLEVLNEVEHAHVHRPPNPVPRHLRPHRQAYMKEYFKKNGWKYSYARKHSDVSSS